AAAARTSDRLLIGSNLGHVECIDAASGESLWLYVFPTMHQTMSYSSYGMPPMMSESAKIFRSENGTPPTSGLQLTDQVGKPTRVIRDPDPTNPFRDLPRLLSIAWAGVVIPVFGVVFLHKHPRTRRWNLAFISLFLASASFACFMYF